MKKNILFFCIWGVDDIKSALKVGLKLPLDEYDYPQMELEEFYGADFKQALYSLKKGL